MNCTAGYWLLASGRWLLVSGYWLLASCLLSLWCYWLLAAKLLGRIYLIFKILGFLEQA
jgi:hypothetical protein